MRVLAACGAGVLALAAPSVARAQEGGPVPCRGQKITDIQVTTRPPFHGKTGRLWEWPIRVANALHSTTKTDVVERFLMLRVGDPCLERHRSESERILRAQTFLIEARVRTVSDGSGGVVLLVETIDEFNPILGFRANGTPPYVESLKLGDGNVLGSGRRMEAEWGKGDFRDRFAARVIDYQFLGHPWILDVGGARGDADVHGWNVDLTHLFLVDEQRVAWRIRAEDSKAVWDFLRGSDPSVQFGIERKFFDVGGVLRIGQPGRLSLFGLSFSREVDMPGLPPVLDSTVSYGPLLSQFRTRSNARVNALWGVRNIYYRRVERFDALNAAQDVRHGFQLGTLFGRSLSALGTTDDDILVATDFYGGTGTSNFFVTVEGRAEGRQSYDENHWDGIIASASGTVFSRVSPHHSLVLTGDYGAGWKQRIPLQLTLGDQDGGVRGYHDSRLAGARRLVMRLEDRWYIGGLFDQVDLGLSPFFDAGFLRGGDAPYGTSTPFKFGAGLGLLGAAPRGSQSTWRLDVGFALSGDPDAKWEVRLSKTNTRRAGYREPRDITASREQSVPSSIFSWP